MIFKRFLKIFNIIEKALFIIFLSLFVSFLFRGNGGAFATKLDKANVLYAYDSGITSYGSEKEAICHKNAVKMSDNIWKWRDYSVNYRNEKNTFLSELLKEAKDQEIVLPSDEYWAELDDFVLKNAWRMHKGRLLLLVNGSFSDDSISKANINEIKYCLDNYGYLKFFPQKKDDVFYFIDNFNKNLKKKIGIEKCPNEDFMNLYKQKLLAELNRHVSFVNIKEGLYGNFTSNHKKVPLELKTWETAYNIGFIECIFIYPIDFYVERITDFIGDYIGSRDFGLLLAFLFVILVMKFLLLDYSIKEDINRQKKIIFKPEIDKVIDKYKNISNENLRNQYIEYEKRLIYKKYGINYRNFSIAFFLNILFFFIFIRAIQNSAVMSESWFNLYLNNSLVSVIFNLNNLKHFVNTLSNSNGFLTAIILSFVNIIVQIIYFKLPNYIGSKYNKLLNNSLKNNVKEKKRNFITILIFFALLIVPIPVNIVIYLILRSLFGIIQSIIVFYFYKDDIIERCNNDQSI